MPGGLLNLVAHGNLNLIINGNPTKTFFKTTYAKHSNFGLQKFKIDFDGLKVLRLTEDSKFSFKIPRYADLLMDTYLVITLPTIWSPILNPDGLTDNMLSYEFKWIDNIGAQLIRKVRYMIGGQIIQEFTGQYLYNMVQRDFSEGKKKLFNEMIGNVPELNDPANYSNRNGYYPNAKHYSEEVGGAEPSIRSKTLYIPLNIWSTLSSKMAIPLVSLQYNYLHIEIECRPIQELFVIRDVLNPNYENIYSSRPIDSSSGILADWDNPNHLSSNNSYHNHLFNNHVHQYRFKNNTKYIKPDQNVEEYRFFRFLHPPPENVRGRSDDAYPSKRSDWYANIHLISTYGFLSEPEVRSFAANPQKYLIKEVHEEIVYDVVGNKNTKINSNGMVSSWMWFFQRSDVDLRNEWSNYTNWPYKELPFSNKDISGSVTVKESGPYKLENQRDIMMEWGFTLDGKIRETNFEAGVFNLIEKYVRTAGNSELGLYCYNFCLNTDPFQHQPSGAINLSKFSNIEFDYKVYTPALDASAQTFVICDSDGGIAGINKPTWKLYQYDYTLHVMEERYNILSFESGNASLQFAR